MDDGIKEKLVVALGEPTLDLCLLGLWCKIKGTELMHFIKKKCTLYECQCI